MMLTSRGWFDHIGGECAYHVINACDRSVIKDVDPYTAFLPLGTLDAGWSHHGSFIETGTGAPNLSGGSQSWSRADTGLGAALAHTVPTTMGRMTFETRAVWQHAFADVTPDPALSFAGSLNGFQVRATDTGCNQANVGASVSWQMSEDLALRVTYDGIFLTRTVYISRLLCMNMGHIPDLNPCQWEGIVTRKHAVPARSAGRKYTRALAH